MKWWMWLMVVVVSVGYAQEEGTYRAKLTFRVVDSLGKPVTNANARVGFYLWSEKPSGATGKTDTNGFFTVEGLCSVDATGQFTKNEYYPTSYKHTFPNPRRTPNAVKDGKWQPWNPTIEITLKEKRNPIPMYVRSIDTQIPKNERIGFDCEKGDWVKPHGKGEVGDFSVCYESSALGWFDLSDKTIRLIISSKEDEGFIELEKDTYSFAQTVYEAPKEGYNPEFVLSLERKEGKMLNEVKLPENRYLVFRSRVKKDEEGNIIHSRFGKIMGIKYGENRLTKEGHGYINFLYYFNPNDNDRNLEYDCVNNLINPRERINAP